MQSEIAPYFEETALPRPSSAIKNSLAVIAALALIALALIVILRAPNVFEDLGRIENPSVPGIGPEGSSESLRVVRIVDGDTLAGQSEDGDEVVVRLLGIDAPEVRHRNGTGQEQCGGAEASQRLEQLAPVGSVIELTGDAHADAEDRYGRRLAYVRTQSTPDAAHTLVSEGLVSAWKPASEPNPERMAAYEAEMGAAKRAGTGSWGRCESLGR